MPKKVVCFIDGENIVFRYQEMRKAGWVPRGGEIVHEPDCFVWMPWITTSLRMDVLRVNYYTTVVGDDDRVAAVSAKIAGTTYKWSAGYPQNDYAEGSAQLIPRVYKKAKQSRSTRAVDINITMDMMRAALSMPIDAIYLGAGDGDYLQLVDEIVRSTSKQVVIAAFSSGLAERLRSCADRFVNLDEHFFAGPPPA